MSGETRFDHVEIPSPFGRLRKKVLKTLTLIFQIFFPLVLYISIFYFGLTFEPLQRSPLLQSIGAISSLIITVSTLIFTFCFGFITGIFEFMRESLKMLPLVQPQLRVVTGLVFVTAIIMRFLNLLAKGNPLLANVFIPLFLGLALFFGVRWFNLSQNLQLSVSEQIFIAIGYPAFYFFQGGRGFNFRRINSENK